MRGWESAAVILGEAKDLFEAGIPGQECPRHTRISPEFSPGVSPG